LHEGVIYEELTPESTKTLTGEGFKFDAKLKYENAFRTRLEVLRT
jgi:hypothetical protein